MFHAGLVVSVVCVCVTDCDHASCGSCSQCSVCVHLCKIVKVVASVTILLFISTSQ